MLGSNSYTKHSNLSLRKSITRDNFESLKMGKSHLERALQVPANFCHVDKDDNFSSDASPK